MEGAIARHEADQKPPLGRCDPIAESLIQPSRAIVLGA